MRQLRSLLFALLFYPATLAYVLAGLAAGLFSTDRKSVV